MRRWQSTGCVVALAGLVTGCAAVLEGERQALDVAARGVDRYCSQMALAASEATRERWRRELEARTGARVSVECPADRARTAPGGST